MVRLTRIKGTDFVDLFMVHTPDSTGPMDESLSELKVGVGPQNWP